MQDPSKPPSPLKKEPPVITSGRTKTLGLEYNIAGMLCYVPIFPINVIFAGLWMATEPQDNQFLRFSAAQSLVLTVVWVALSIVLWLANAIVGMLPFLGFVAFAVRSTSFFIYTIYLAANIWGVAKAYGGKTCELPMISQYAQKYM
jgi:uncharacterized membrane protein